MSEFYESLKAALEQAVAYENGNKALAKSQIVCVSDADKKSSDAKASLQGRKFFGREKRQA